MWPRTPPSTWNNESTKGSSVMIVESYFVTAVVMKSVEQNGPPNAQFVTSVAATFTSSKSSPAGEAF